MKVRGEAYTDQARTVGTGEELSDDSAEKTPWGSLPTEIRELLLAKGGAKFHCSKCGKERTSTGWNITAGKKKDPSRECGLRPHYRIASNC